MKSKFENIVFEGGGVWGIAYLGMLDYLCHADLLDNLSKVAGTSAGAITACLTSFNLPFSEMITIANSLEYSKIPSTSELLSPTIIPKSVKATLNNLFDNVDCAYRLITKYGWYSTDYFYDWIKTQIAKQFDPGKKQPPYTFRDFKDASLHLDGRPFKDLYIIGTDISNRISCVFGYQSHPDMEVAEAVRISMSIPLFFESVKTAHLETRPSGAPSFFSDGGVMYNYPINLFDQDGIPAKTLGGMFKSELNPQSIKNLVDFITNVLACTLDAQRQVYMNNPEDMVRSIIIETRDVSATDFNVKVGDSAYNFLYRQGYIAAQKYFERLN